MKGGRDSVPMAWRLLFNEADLAKEVRMNKRFNSRFNSHFCLRDSQLY